MAEISSYPLKAPKLGDLITFSETYDANAANPVIGNPTKSATVGSINALAVNGTVGTIPVFTGSNIIGDSQLVQLGPNLDGVYQIKFNNSDRIIINKPSSVSFGDPEFLVMQDDVAKVSMGWDDDGDGYGYLYNWAGNGWRFGSTGNNPELTIVTTAGQEGVSITNKLSVNGGSFLAGETLFDGDARFDAGVIDSQQSYGSIGQVLSSRGASQNVLWVDPLSGSGIANSVARWTGSNTLTASSIRDNGTNVGIGQDSGVEKLTVNSGGNTASVGIDGVFIKDPFAGGTRFVNSNNPMLALGTAAMTDATSTIFMGHNATAENQESKIEYNRGTSSDAKLSIWFKGQGTYREHLRFGNISSSTPRSVFFGNVGINTTSPSAKLDVDGSVKASEDIEITTSNEGLILKSPDGTRYRVTVANGGTLSVSAV